MADSQPTPPPQTVMNPARGTTIETSPEALGLSASPPPLSPLSDIDDQDRHGSGFLSRALDKLSRSKSLSSSKVDKQPGTDSARSTKRRSIGAMSRKRKTGEASTPTPETTTTSQANAGGEPNHTIGLCTPTTEYRQEGVAAPSDRTLKPSNRPSGLSTDTLQPVSRPSIDTLNLFRGDGSMRMGTQTLIQALSAIPWEEDHDEDGVPHGQHALEGRVTPTLSSDSDDDNNHERRDFLASSIHAIHRPVARSRRGTPAVGRTPATAKPRTSEGKDGYFGLSDNEAVEETELEDVDVDDLDYTFKPAVPPPTIALPADAIYDPRAPSPITTPDVGTPMISGTGPRVKFTLSPATTLSPSTTIMGPSAGTDAVRLKRKARLAVKLQEVFGLKQVEEVVAEMPCWLLRSVLLQGYMYLTSHHLCFFAHMPSREDKVLKSGSLSKKASRTKLWSKYWYMLKNDVLSWYQSSADPYFPVGNVDLRYATFCERVGERELKLRTTAKTIHLQADSVPSRDEWVKAIKKVIFKAQNHGESVKISLPYSAVIDVEKSTAIDFSETIEVKVVDKDDNFTIDSYFFAYFHDLNAAFLQIKECMQAYKDGMLPDLGGVPPSATVRDTTAAVRASILHAMDSNSSQAAGTSITSVASAATTTGVLPISNNSSRFSGITSLLGLGRAAASAPTAVDLPETHEKLGGEDFTHVSYAPAAGGVNLAPSSTSMGSSRTPVPIAGRRDDSVQHATESDNGHTYPPSTPSDDADFRQISVHDAKGHPVESSSSLAGYVPSWLKNPSRRLFGTSTGENMSLPHEPGAVHEVYESRPSAMFASGTSSVVSGGTGENSHLGFSILETPSPEDAIDPQMVDKFRGYFALDEKEQLLGYFPGYLFRVLPLYGRIYISTNFFCYRSGQPLRKTLMKIPLVDIISTELSKAFRFGHQGLIVIIKGHEELFFEFGSYEKRAACVALLDQQKEDAQRRARSGETITASKSKSDAVLLEELEPAGYLGESALYAEEPRPPPETEIMPAVMFTSNSSTFLEFKPQEKLHITCLTIGSRGDCQPYIALCKRLQADGHTCRIATHEEYRDWVVGHGIEFSAVGGDPAELMRICVENGMFTVGFLKETMQKFRGWLDDLLATSWTACQGTDLLIESPSAMGGIHIAEALRIPYFRAFTMPYTRTRAYPHAFAVPERKMGGSYNYMTYVMFDQVFWRALSGQVNRWRRQTLGIASTNYEKLEQHKVPFLYNFSPSVVPPPLDWYEWIRVTGYWFLDAPDDSATKKWTPPDDLVSFIDSAHALGKKVVYIGFGSIVVSDPEAMTRAVVESIQLSGVYAILSKGWSDRLSTKKNNVHPEVPEIKLPPQIYPIQSIPHDWLFPRIDAACHHGGAGTTGASLRAGIPTIIRPFFGDQFFWADRVEALDVGSAVKKLTVDNLTEALRLATTDVKQIEKAKLLGEKIRKETGVDNAVEAIYRDLEYARSLIKQPSTPDSEPIDIPVVTPDRSATDEDPKGGTSEWSVISGEEGSERGKTAINTVMEQDPSPPPIPNPKRTSIGGALSALSSALPRPHLSKRVSSSSEGNSKA